MLANNQDNEISGGIARQAFDDTFGRRQEKSPSCHLFVRWRLRRVKIHGRFRSGARLDRSYAIQPVAISICTESVRGVWDAS